MDCSTGPALYCWLITLCLVSCSDGDASSAAKGTPGSASSTGGTGGSATSSGSASGAATKDAAAAGGFVGAGGAAGNDAGAAGSSTGGADADAEADADPDGTSSGGSDSDCSSEGVRFSMTGAFARTSTDALAYYQSTPSQIFGIFGSTDGKQFGFSQVGDPADGSLGEQGTYDVSSYPYNIDYTESDLDPGQMCGPSTLSPLTGPCSGFYAFAGTIIVTQVTPNYEATFTLTMLTENVDGLAPGAPLEGEVSGCISVPNPWP